MSASLASRFWLSSCNSRTMRTESPTETFTRRLAGRCLLITNSTHVAFCFQAGTQSDRGPHPARCHGKELDSLGEADVSCAICATTSGFHSGIPVRTSGGTCEAAFHQSHDRSIGACLTSRRSPALWSLENAERAVMHGAAHLRLHLYLVSAVTESVGVALSPRKCLQDAPIRHQLCQWHKKP